LWPKLGSVEVIAETIVRPSPAVEKNSVAIVKSKSNNNNVTLAKFIEKVQKVKKRNENRRPKVVKNSSDAKNDAVSMVTLEKKSGSISATKLGNVKKGEISVQELWKDKKEDTVLLIGDFLARGVGCHLNQLPPNAFKKTYAYRSNRFSKNHLPEPR